MMNCSQIWGELPHLWELYDHNKVNTSDCFKGCSNASNIGDVPIEWGGRKVSKSITLSIFKDNLWYLNQRVKIGDSACVQNADGTYNAIIETPANTGLEITVNDVSVGYIYFTNTPKYNPDTYTIFLGDCSAIATIYDFTQGDIHEDLIESNTGEWSYNAEVGGFMSRLGGTSSVTLRLPAAKYNVIVKSYIKGGLDDECNIGGFLEVSSSKIYTSDRSLFTFTHTDGSVSFRYSRSYTSAGNDKYFCIKQIATLTTPPALPENFTPIPAALLAMNGAVIADYKAVNYRLTRVENALGFNG